MMMMKINGEEKSELSTILFHLRSLILIFVFLKQTKLSLQESKVLATRV
jgi:hypothetical protein